MNEQTAPNLIFYHGLIVLGSLLTLFILIHMLYNRRTPSSIMAWLLSIILIPYISIFLYLIIGSRKRKNRYKKKNIILKNIVPNKTILNHTDRVLRNYGIADATKNSEFKLFFNAVDTYNEFLDSINSAKKSIYISTYIFNYDATTKKIIKAIEQRAKDGVEVKILIDSLGSIKLYFFNSKLKELRNAGANIKFFMPIFQMPLRNYINLRNHRKIFIFDNEKVLSGGINLSNEYLGAKEDKKRWEDIMFMLKGDSVEQFFEIFASDWFYASGEQLSFDRDLTQQNSAKEIFLQVVPSGPDMNKDILYEVLLSSIYGAKEKIYIITPYFIPNSALIQALIIAKHKGVDVRLVTPKEANHMIVNLVRSSYMRELEEAGIKIHLYNGSMLHAKAILFDSKSVVLGSANFDNRSLFLNYEVATFIYCEEIIQEVYEWTQKLISNASLGSEEASDMRKIFENLTRVLAPQL